MKKKKLSTHMQMHRVIQKKDKNPKKGDYMNRIVLCIVLSGLLISYVAQVAVNNEWPMYRHDPQHSGFSPSRMPVHFKKVWEYDKHADPYATGRSMWFIVYEGMLIVVDSSSLSASDSTNGSLLWESGIEGGHFPTAADGKVFVTGSWSISCLDAYTGEVLWSHTDISTHFSSPLTVVDGYVITGSWEGFADYWGSDWEEKTEEAYRKQKRVLCLNAETGEVVWEFYGENSMSASPAYYDGHVYINDGYKKVYCLNVKTGELIWKNRTESFSSSSLSLDEERMYIGTYGGVLNCHHRETGEPCWKFRCSASVRMVPALGYSKVYFGAVDGVFYCLDAQTGELIWKRETGAQQKNALDSVFSSVIVADDKVAFVTDGTIYIVDCHSGEYIASHTREGSGISRVVLSKGYFFVGERNGRITCFEESDESTHPIPEPSHLIPESIESTQPIFLPASFSACNYLPFLFLAVIGALLGILAAYYLVTLRRPRND